METTFKYNGKIISTPNLEKKLKRMKISINDIEIIPTKKVEIEDEIYEDEYENLVLITPLDTIKRVVRVLKGTRPDPVNLLKKNLWNPKTKTGIKEFTLEFLKTLKYE